MLDLLTEIALHLLAVPLVLFGVAGQLLLVAALLLLVATALLVATTLLFDGVERIAHVMGSFSRRDAASSAAMRPSASSRRISLRRSASRSGSAWDGKPSARITA